MATYFVNKSGNNTTGSSWANAYTTMAACIARPVAAGDTIWVGDDHTENPAATFTWTFPGVAQTAPYFIACVDHTVASPGFADLRQGVSGAGSFISTGATTVNISGNFYMYGLYFLAGTGATGASITLNSVNGHVQVYERCSFGFGNTGGSLTITVNTGGGASRYTDCTFRFGAASQTITMRNTRLLRCNVNTVAGVQPTTLVAPSQGRNIIEDCDFSNLTSLTFLVGNPSTQNSYQLFKRCKLPNVPLVSTTSSSSGETHLTETVQCDTGSALYRNDRTMIPGVLTTNAVAARASGAVDDVTPVSWKITTPVTTAWHVHFSSAPIVVWNDNVTTPVSITVEGVADPRDFAALPKNDEIWVEAEYFGNAGSVVGKIVPGTKANPWDTAAVVTHTASTADWTAGAVTERVYPGTYFAGTMIKVSSNPGRLFICTATGNITSILPAAYASCVDGGSVTDGAATFRAMWRWKQTITTPAAPAFAGYIYVTVKAGKPSIIQGCYIDPLAVLA